MIIDNLEPLKRANKKPFHTLEIRLQQLANIGVDEVVVVKFDSKIQSTQGKEFASTLKETYNVVKFVVGADFAMGKMAAYKSKNIAADFDTTIVKEQKINDKKISTSLFREFVEFGDVKQIKMNSPFYFTIDIDVKANKTFKMSGLTPHPGIYATWAIINDVKYWSITRISKTGTHEIKIPDLNVKNSRVDAQIEFVDKVRSVIRNDFDKFEEKDNEIAIQKLKNNL